MSAIQHCVIWTRGRQGTGYFKRRLLSLRIGSFGTGVFILKFPQGCDVPRHQDPVDGYSHYRLNIVLQHAERGGEFLCDKPILNLSRFKLFRPDKSPHSVSRIEKGTRYVLSIGLALKAGETSGERFDD